MENKNIRFNFSENYVFKVISELIKATQIKKSFFEFSYSD